MLRCWATGGLGCAVLALLCAVSTARVASAQVLPDEPISLAGGRVVFGAEVSATIAPEDPGFFNYTSYEFSALRNLRIGVSTEVRANDRIQLMGEVRLDQGHVLEAYGLYVRVRPFASRRFDVQAGRVPPTFGLMTRSSYGSTNILIGQPLAYQYLTSIKADALPAGPDDLLRMRGRGWLSNFPVGNAAPGPGLPLVNTARWDTGVQAHGVAGVLEMTGSITTGSLSDPLFHDNNLGRQLAGRIVARPTAAMAFGASASRGAWLDRSLDTTIGEDATKNLDQIAFGGDAEYSAGPFLVRGEVIRMTWAMPSFGALQLTEPLAAISSLIEGRYKVAPGLYVAMRGDRLDFSRITGSAGVTEWEAQTWRVETGIGYSLTRSIIFKGVWQVNGRDGGRVRKDSLGAVQVLYWF